MTSSMMKFLSWSTVPRTFREAKTSLSGLGSMGSSTLKRVIMRLIVMTAVDRKKTYFESSPSGSMIPSGLVRPMARGKTKAPRLIIQ